jgi:hypothetical protein
MPVKKKDKNRTGTGLSSLEENARVSPAAFERGGEAWEVSSSFPVAPGDWRKRIPKPDPIVLQELDEQLILTYLTYHRLLEQALVRAGFVMALSSNKRPRPDWYSWARHIEKQFDPLSSEEVGMSVAHLLDLRDDMEALPGRMQNRLTWESDSRFSDNLWLAEMIQRTSSLLTHRYNFAEAPGCDTPQLMAALFVVEAWLPLVPEG